MSDLISDRQCECGCGGTTETFRGKSRRYIYGHNNKIILEKRYVIVASGCWIWTSNVNYKGYGLIRVGRETLVAHRYMYELKKGKIPEGLLLHHKCGIRKCINPEHLQPMTRKEHDNIIHSAIKIPYIQSPGIKATCHLHKKPKGFKSIEELQQHEMKEHRVWKG